MASSSAAVASSGLAKVNWLGAAVGCAATAGVGPGPIDSHPVRTTAHSVKATERFLLSSIYPARLPARPPPPVLPPEVGWPVSARRLLWRCPGLAGRPGSVRRDCRIGW